jgi:putative endonuclease
VRERLAAAGCEIIGSRCPGIRGSGAGEIDIIAKKGRLIVFVEVKKRRNLDLAAQCVAPAQQERIYRNAEAFLARHKEYRGFDCRFDAALLDGEYRLEYIENAWRT